ncbi:hypothetical protein AVEN_55552-1 [Araneus ventricosus]|uniref:Uncharacterized protein n=1 Tax=Araneus ventricosus TaxID=182803 RepID=A0A4Y2WT10_ARAVE|nr:hypothetical protein AVEN_55552-1 [Araneus ventricosus]
MNKHFNVNLNFILLEILAGFNYKYPMSAFFLGFRFSETALADAAVLAGLAPLDDGFFYTACGVIRIQLRSLTNVILEREKIALDPCGDHTSKPSGLRCAPQ